MTQRPGYSGNRAPAPPAGGGDLNIQQYSRQAAAIIANGDTRELVQLAEKLGQQGQATRTSVRRLYGEARRIGFLLEQDEAKAIRRAMLFEPRIHYQVKRDPGQGLRSVAEALLAMLQEVNRDGAPNPRERFERFTDFFEALVAYLPEKREK